jgi:hypothetical protein
MGRGLRIGPRSGDSCGTRAYSSPEMVRTERSGHWGTPTPPAYQLRGEVDIHTSSGQMGKPAAMIERHYSKLTPTLAAEWLA